MPALLQPPCGEGSAVLAADFPASGLATLFNADTAGFPGYTFASLNVRMQHIGRQEVHAHATNW
jgi:hypothetical protein